MMMKVFTVYDSKIEAYTPPFFQRSAGEAIRSFSDACQRDGNFKSHPEDYTLFELGGWDDSTAKFALHATPHSLGVALEFSDRSDKSLKRDFPNAASLEDK